MYLSFYSATTRFIYKVVYYLLLSDLILESNNGKQLCVWGNGTRRIEELKKHGTDFAMAFCLQICLTKNCLIDFESITAKK